MVEIGNVFRGKRKDNGKWVVGFYTGPCGAKLINAHWISGIDDLFATPRLVDPSTIGECTKLKDKNGNWIFEGDILRWNEQEWGCPHTEVVKWDYDLLSQKKNDWKEWCEIIGNIHDNQSLLEEHKNA